jgi:hypothetical protein
MLRKIVLLMTLCTIAVGIVLAYRTWISSTISDARFQEVANGDAHFWLMQGGPSDRNMPCTVYYNFDQPLDEATVRLRIQELANTYQMFQRNVVEIDGLPYWQSVKPDWSENFRVLNADDNIETIRIETDAQLSKAAKPGEGLPLFRAYLSADRRQLIFIWHHIISDLEGMFNKHAKHLFAEQGERTHFGYQIDANTETASSADTLKPLRKLLNTDRPLGFKGSGFKVEKFVLPVQDQALNRLAQRAGLSMSDIFSFITLRAVTQYHTALGDAEHVDLVPVLTPLSLRTSALDLDEGNNRATKQFPFVFPEENIADMYTRIIALAPSDSSYNTAGKSMKIARQFSFLEPILRKIAMPDYISNYFPLADIPLAIHDAKLVSHALRVPMVPFERSKFAWSNYNGEVQLFLHIDPQLVDSALMRASFEKAVTEVLQFLENRSR